MSASDTSEGGVPSGDFAPVRRRHTAGEIALIAVVIGYAGILLADSEGHAVGTLCTWDDNPRRWTSGQIQILNDLAQVVRTKVFGGLGGEQPKPQQPASSIFATNRRRRRL